MGKHIDNMKAVIVNETRRQLIEKGFLPVTMRSVASGIGVSAGTLYNYFESKDAMIAEVMIEDWLSKRAETEELASKCASFTDGLMVLFQGLQQFSEAYGKVFDGPAFTESEQYSFSACHSVFKKQIYDCLKCAADNMFHINITDSALGIITAVIIACVRDKENLSDYLPDLIKVLG